MNLKILNGSLFKFIMILKDADAFSICDSGPDITILGFHLDLFTRLGFDHLNAIYDQFLGDFLRVIF